MSDYTRIYLQPECCADPDMGRLWCQDNEPETCPDGEKWTPYVLASELDQKQADLDRALARVADAIGSLETVSGKAELGASVARAERTETMNYVAEGFDVIKEYAQSEATRLRQQADQLENTHD